MADPTPPLLPEHTDTAAENSIEPRNPTKSQIRREWLKPFQWKPGQSGNLGGRPKKKPVTEAYEWILDMPYPPAYKKKLEAQLGLKLRNDLTFAQAIAIGNALRAVVETGAAEAITNRIEGAIKQSVEVGATGGGPLIAPILITQYVELSKDGTRIVDVTPEEPENSNGNGNGNNGTAPVPDPIP